VLQRAVIKRELNHDVTVCSGRIVAEGENGYV
jgi:hypothetical protein